MAQQYVEGPEAKGMETGFALDELLRKERGDTARTMFNAAAQRDMQRQRLQQQGLDAEQQQRFALERMVKGEDLKEQYAQKEAMRGAPFIQQMLSGGNMEANKAFGYTTPVPGQGAVPEAGYAGTPDTVAARTPSLQEAAGLTRAIPGIAQSLLTHKLTDRTEKPMVVGENAALVSPKGEVLYQGKGRVVNTQQEAEATRDDMIRRNPALVGRVTIQQDPAHGGWTVKEQASESLVEGPNQWISTFTDVNAPVGARILAAQKLEKWKEIQPQVAGAKALAVAQSTPFTEEAKKRLETTNMAIQAANSLMQYTREEREQFTGAGKTGYFLARKAQELGLPSPGYSPEQVERYSNFVRDNGMIEQFKFAVGGKQLTQGEQKVVESFIPTGREFTTAEYEAKLQGIKKAMEAAQAVDMWLSVSPKTDINPESIRAMYVKQLQQVGIDVTKNAEDQARSQMKSGDRLLHDFLPGGKK